MATPHPRAAYFLFHSPPPHIFLQKDLEVTGKTRIFAAEIKLKEGIHYDRTKG